MKETEQLLEEALMNLSQHYSDELERLANELEALKTENDLIKQMFGETIEQNRQISEQLQELEKLLKRL